MKILKARCSVFHNWFSPRPFSPFEISKRFLRPKLWKQICCRFVLLFSGKTFGGSATFVTGRFLHRPLKKNIEIGRVIKDFKKDDIFFRFKASNPNSWEVTPAQSLPPSDCYRDFSETHRITVLSKQNKSKNTK